MASYNKLVRDKIPEMLDGRHIPYEKRIASESEYRTELIKKLFEEVTEFQEDPCVEELADVLEVVLALQKLDEFSTLEDVRKQKQETRGGFEKRIILKGEK